MYHTCMHKELNKEKMRGIEGERASTSSAFLRSPCSRGGRDPVCTDIPLYPVSLLGASDFWLTRLPCVKERHCNNMTSTIPPTLPPNLVSCPIINVSLPAPTSAPLPIQCCIPQPPSVWVGIKYSAFYGVPPHKNINNDPSLKWVDVSTTVAYIQQNFGSYCLHVNNLVLNSGQEPACKVLKTLIVTWQDIGYGGGSGAAIVAENDFFYFPHIPTCFPSREVTAKGGNGELDCVPRHL